MNDRKNTEMAEECEVLYEWIEGHITTLSCVYTHGNAELFLNFRVTFDRKCHLKPYNVFLRNVNYISN